MSNNKIILQGSINQFKIDNELKCADSEVFELFSLTQITKNIDLPFEDILNSIVDGGNDGGIDSIFVIVDDLVPQTPDELDDIIFNRKTQVSITISQCKKEDSFKEGVLDKLITSLPELFSLNRNQDYLLKRFNPSVVEKALIAREAWKKCLGAGGKLSINFNYCTFADKIIVNGVFEAKSNQLIALASKHFIGAKISYSNFSCEELLKLFQIQKNYRLSLIFKDVPLSTSFENYGIGYVGTVNLADYVEFLRDEDASIREDLFESNIRHFQGPVDVNKKIKYTIESPGNEDFWWLNNGITIIATNPSLVGTTLSIDDIQIVNGLQTSYSIFLNHNGNKDDKRSVLVKVIVNENKEVIDHIIASTNSQNPVLPAALRATDDIQRELELFFKNKGYYYDRRKNYYKNQGKPASKIFGIQFNAQAVEAILFGNPHLARSKPTSMIKEDAAYSKIFNQAYDYNIYLNCCIIAQKTSDYFRDCSESEKNILSNFKLHLARTATSFALKRSKPSRDEIAGLNLDAYTKEEFNRAKDLVIQSLVMYMEETPEANLINVAKTKQFTDYMLSRIA